MWDSQLLQHASSRWCFFGFTYLGPNIRLRFLGSDTMLNLIVWGFISKPIGYERSNPSILYGVWVSLVFPMWDSQFLQHPMLSFGVFSLSKVTIFSTTNWMTLIILLIRLLISQFPGVNCPSNLHLTALFSLRPIGNPSSCNSFSLGPSLPFLL